MNILIVIISAIPAILLLAVFMKKEYSLEEEINIARPRDVVFDYVRQLRNQEYYSKWVMCDPQSLQYHGDDGQPGFVATWDSNDKRMGKGEQEIISIAPQNRIDLQLRFIKPFEGVADAYMTTDISGENATSLKWGFKSSMKYPMNLLLPILNIEGILRKDLRTSLENLKKELEK